MAIEELHNKKMSNGQEFYVCVQLSKADREKQKLTNSLNQQNIKKKCNLYIKNIPPTWDSDTLKNLFVQYGEIESVQYEGNSNGLGFTYGYVCFKDPGASERAKAEISMMTFDAGRQLIIEHYEIKEIRMMKEEEERDKQDWDKYIKSYNPGQNLTSQLANHSNLTLLIQQMLNMQIQQT